MKALDRNWLAEMIDYCEMVGDRPRLAKALGRHGETSQGEQLTYEELMCQVFDDLRARENLAVLVDQMFIPSGLRAAIPCFVFALDQYGKSKAGQSGDISFLAVEWKFVEEGARSVVEAFGAAKRAGFRLESQ